MFIKLDMFLTVFDAGKSQKLDKVAPRESKSYLKKLV